jgi:rfaE bifunctional protein nucleotidyltransferase chain/domain
VRTVLAHGVFDVLHIGHIRLLKRARSLGEELVVSILSDRFVTKYKGPTRPIHLLEARTEQLLELRCVDRVVVVDGPGHEAVQEMIERVRPAVYVKGRATKGTFGEEAFVKSRGIELVFVDMVTRGGKPISSTRASVSVWDDAAA